MITHHADTHSTLRVVYVAAERAQVGATLTRNGRWHATATVVAVSGDGRHVITRTRYGTPVCSCGQTCEHVRKVRR